MAIISARIAIALQCLLLLGCSDNQQNDAFAPADKPIAAFFGQQQIIDNGKPNAGTSNASNLLLGEELTAECMRSEGFEYIPFVKVEQTKPPSYDGVEPDSHKWSEVYGYGISTLYFTADEVGPGLVGRTEEASTTDKRDEDPNAKIVASLDEETRQAYDKALHGSLPQDITTKSEPQVAFIAPDGGCRSEGYRRAGLSFAQDFQKELSRLFEAVLADPRVTTRVDEITTCMAKQGFEYLGPGTEGAGYYTELFSITQLIDTESRGSPLPAEARSLLADLQHREVVDAVTFFECGGNQTDLYAIIETVQKEHEQRFFEENHDALVAYRDAGVMPKDK